jgi:hypothetical protein
MSATTSRIPSGWLFAAILIAIAGSLNLVSGIAAVADDEIFAEGSLLFESLQTWGWVHIIIGALELGIAVLIFRANPWGAGLGMFGAFLAIMANFLSIGAYPLWSCILIAINFVVIFQLATNWE